LGGTCQTKTEIQKVHGGEEGVTFKTDVHISPIDLGPVVKHGVQPYERIERPLEVSRPLKGIQKNGGGLGRLDKKTEASRVSHTSQTPVHRLESFRGGCKCIAAGVQETANARELTTPLGKRDDRTHKGGRPPRKHRAVKKPASSIGDPGGESSRSGLTSS